jgi:hypothetical protein
LRATSWVPVNGCGLRREVKCRANGFRELCGWLASNDALIIKADRHEPVVVVRLSMAAQIAERDSVQDGSQAGHSA